MQNNFYIYLHVCKIGSPHKKEQKEKKEKEKKKKETKHTYHWGLQFD